VDFTSTSSIDDLSDVDTSTTTPTDGQALVWNNTNSEWEPGDVGIDGLVTTLDGDDVRTWRPEVGGYGVDTAANDDNAVNLGLGEGPLSQTVPGCFLLVTGLMIFSLLIYLLPGT